MTAGLRGFWSPSVVGDTARFQTFVCLTDLLKKCIKCCPTIACLEYMHIKFCSRNSIQKHSLKRLVTDDNSVQGYLRCLKCGGLLCCIFYFYAKFALVELILDIHFIANSIQSSVSTLTLSMI